MADIVVTRPGCYQCAGDGISLQYEPAATIDRQGRNYDAITLLMVNTGKSSASATPPMIAPMTMIINGSI